MQWKAALFCLVLATTNVIAHAEPTASPNPGLQMVEEKTLIELSRQKWLWMAERNIQALDNLFDERSVFVHMSRTLTKSQELEVITTGNIQYKMADVKESSVRFIGDTAIVLNRIDLFAIVRGTEANNPFMVTEVYVKKGGGWRLGSLSFTRLVTPESTGAPNSQR